MSTELIRGLRNFAPQHKGCVATIGNFDGVHHGHQALLARVVEQARVLGVPSLAIIFEPQPLEYLAPHRQVPRLTRCREKFQWLAKFGLDKVLVVQFNQAIAAMTPEEFIDLLFHRLGIRHLVIGEDFHFGKARQGNVALLQEAGKRLGFVVDALDDVMFEGERISSTRIRQVLLHGDHGLANQLLGHPYCIIGRIIHGDKQGRTFGFPTANIYQPRKLMVVSGIYAVKLHGIQEKPLPGVAYIAHHASATKKQGVVEVHLFDFDQDIYGRYVNVEFCKKIREDRAFDDIGTLKKQMEKDADEAHHYLMNTLFNESK